MTLRDNDRGRPTANRAASNVISDGDNSTVPESRTMKARCRRCRHPLTAPASICRGVGPVCVHLEISDALAVVA